MQLLLLIRSLSIGFFLTIWAYLQTMMLTSWRRSSVAGASAHKLHCEDKARERGWLGNGRSICHCRSTLTALPEAHLLATKGQSLQPRAQREFLQHSGATSHPHKVLCKTTLQEQKPSFCNNLTFIAFAGKKFYSSRKTVLPYTKPTTEFIQKPDAAINVKMRPSLNLR